MRWTGTDRTAANCHLPADVSGFRVMPTPEFYRSEADRLRAEAGKGKGAEVSRLLRLATEYDQLADSMDPMRSEKPRRP
jgi:hypothetical protein